MNRIVPTFGVSLLLTAALVQGDSRLPLQDVFSSETNQSYSFRPLPWLVEQAPAPKALKPVLPPYLYYAPPIHPYRYQPSESIPHSYMVFGLRTDANGMVFTSQNGAVLPVPSQPHLIFNPNNAPRISVPSALLFTPPPTSKQK